MSKSDAVREPGFYWTRSRNPEYPAESISEWNGRRWHHSGVSATSEDREIEVLSPRIEWRPQTASSTERKEQTTLPIEVVGSIAPPGWVWQCGACGKRIRDRYGESGGWDESCMLNSVLVKDVFGVQHG